MVRFKMRRLKAWYWGFPLIVLLAFAGWFAATQVMERGVSPGPEGRAPEARAPGEATRPAPELPTFRAVRDGDRIILSGTLPSEASRAALLERAKQAVPNGVLSDETKVSGAAPPPHGEAAALALTMLERLPSATATIADGAIVIAGQSPDVDVYNAVVAARARIPAGYRLDIAALVPPPVRPYTWSASVSEDEIALTGYVPSEAAHEGLRTAASRAFPDKRLVDGLQPGSGLAANLDFTTVTGFALAQLGPLRAGSADLVDGTLSLRGEVTDRDTRAALVAAVQSGLPPGLRLGATAIAVRPPSPYAFRARREAGTLTLTGYYPDRAARTAIETLIRDRFFSEQVVDKLRPAEGAPKGYLAGVSFGLEHLSRLAAGEVAISGASVEVKGEALYEQTAEQTARAVRAVSLPGWTGKAEVTLRSSEKAPAEP